MNVDVTLEVTSDAARFQLPKSSAHHPPVLVQLPAANRALFPKKHIEKELKDAPGGTSIVLWGEHSTGTSLVAIGYKYNKKSVLYFVSTPGAGTTEDGEPYEMKWADEHGNINVRHVPRPEVISHFFQHSNSVDVHNHLRQYCLKLEKKWVTNNCWMRLFTTLLSINTVDTFRLSKFHNLLPTGKFSLTGADNIIHGDEDESNNYTMRKFAGVLATQLLIKARMYREAKSEGSSSSNKKRKRHHDDDTRNASYSSEHSSKRSKHSSKKSADRSTNKPPKNRANTEQAYMVPGHRFRLDNTVSSYTSESSSANSNYITLNTQQREARYMQ